MMQIVGFMMIMIAGCIMDSPSLVAPVVMVLAGSLLILGGAKYGR